MSSTPAALSCSIWRSTSTSPRTRSRPFGRSYDIGAKRVDIPAASITALSTAYGLSDAMPAGREAPPVHEAHRGALAVRRVHGGEPQPRRLGDVPLRGPGPVREGLDHLELVEGQIHPHPPFMFGFKLYFMNTNMESADQIAGG